MKLRLPIGAWGRVDWWLYILSLLLVGIGIAVITALFYGTPRVSLAIGQAIYAGVGIAAMAVVSRIDYRNWRGLAPVIYGAILVLLVGVMVFGVTIFGAQRWLSIAGFQLQPAELLKLGMVLVLARYLADREQFHWRDYAALAGLIGVPVLFVLRQPDLGSTIIVMAAASALVVASRIPRRVLAGVVGLGVLAAPILWQFLEDYQHQRILTFLNPAADPYGAGYNVLQALIAVGSGGIFGAGLGQGSQSQLQFIPVVHTDFIFAGLAEETGLVGASILLLLLFFLIFRVIRVARLAKDDFGYLVGVGIAALLLSQTVINIGMNLALMPVTGIPLPFVSHGGTALITNFIAIGILQSIIARHKRITF